MSPSTQVSNLKVASKKYVTIATWHFTTYEWDKINHMQLLWSSTSTEMPNLNIHWNYTKDACQILIKYKCKTSKCGKYM